MKSCVYRSRRILALCLILVLSISLCACGKKNSEEKTLPAAAEENAESAGAEGAKTEEQGAAEESGAANVEDSASAEEVSDQAGEAADDAAGESDPAAVIPCIEVVSNWEWLDNNDYDNYQAYAELKVDGLIVINEGFDALQKSLQALNAKRLENSKWYSENVRAIVDEYGADDEFARATMPWSYDDDAIIKRNDDCYLSFYKAECSFLGGAHPNTVYYSYNFDVKTGKQLELEDVITARDKLQDALLETLEKHPYEDTFFDGWEDTLASLIWGDVELNWTLQEDGIEVLFDTYSLGPYAMGPVDVLLKAEEYPDLLKQDYFKKTNVNLAKQVFEAYIPEDDFYFDADGDGQDEVLRVNTDYIYNSEYDYKEYEWGLITFGRDIESAKTTKTENHLEISDFWLMKRNDGKYYLYVDVRDESDWQSIMIYDVSNPDKGAIYRGENKSGGFYGIRPIDPNHVYISHRLYIFGTYHGYQECYVGDGGQLVPYKPEYKIRNLNYDACFQENGPDPVHDKSNAHALFAKQEFLGYAYRNLDTKEDLEEITIKKGTALIPYATDGSTYMTFVTRQGMYIDIYYDETDEEWNPRLIQGIQEEELLDGMLYAG